MCAALASANATKGRWQAGVFFLGCSKDVYEEPTKLQEGKDYVIKSETFEALDSNILFHDAYKKSVKGMNGLNASLGLASKNSSKELYGYEIDSTDIKVVEKLNYKSYSIALKKALPDFYIYENIFIEEQDSKTRATLIKYYVDASEQITNIEVTPLSEQPAEGKCVLVTFYISISCGCAGHHEVGEEGCDCPEAPPIMVTDMHMSCTFPDFSSGGGETSPGSNHGAGGGDTGSPSTDTAAAAPNFAMISKLRKKHFEQTLHNNGLDNVWNNLGEQQQGQINQYLLDAANPIEGLLSISEYYPQDAVEFAVEAIQALNEGNTIDFPNKIIIDQSFSNTPIECLHNKMKANPNNFYSQMLSTFQHTTTHNLTLGTGTVPVGDYGITGGDINHPNNYTLTFSPQLSNQPTLIQMASMCHEMIHAFMFDTLESNNQLIEFDEDGVPKLNVPCDGYENIGNLTVPDRFIALMCALNAANLVTENWTHDLFNNNVFSVVAYQQQLANFILSTYDWNSETGEFQQEAQALFGNNWKSEIARRVAWIGLEHTDAYTDYLNTYIATPLKSTYLVTFSSKIINAANIPCP
jgi:hypothetical protein